MVISVAEAARILGVSESYTRRLLRDKKIEGRRLQGWVWLVDRDSVFAYAAQRKRASK